ncbi:HDOD domain-containing protein [Candidatus Latescibacterota bacterium]
MTPVTKQNVLVIQHDDSVLKTLKEGINKLGYHAIDTHTLSAATRVLDSEPLHMVLVGPYEFGAEGEKFLSNLHTTFPNIILIATVSDTQKNSPENLLRLGADQYLVIPRDLNRIAEMISVAGERNRQMLELRSKFEKLERTTENKEKELDRCQNLAEQNFFDTVKAFIGLLEIRDLNMGSHCKRVATFSSSLMERYDLGDRVKYEVEVGALLHDIGKISIPDHILVKTRDFFSKVEMTNKERDIYRQHPVIGQEAVEMVNMLSNVGVYIRHHHERFDGKGFPDGLEGFHIPLGARIITMVDAYDKIVYSMPQKKRQEAEFLFIKFMDKNKGFMFDPEISRKMRTLMNELKRQEFSNERRVSIANLAPGMVLSRDVYTKSGVLVISQYEKITGNDIMRLIRFLTSNMILDGVYVFGTESTVITSSGGLKAVSFSPADREVSDISIAEVRAAIDAARDFSTIPEVHQTVSAKIQDAKYTRRDITAIIQRCPVISLRILRFANSPLFNMSRKVKTVTEAAKVLGMNEVRRIMLTTPVIDTEGKTEGLDHLLFWTHMLGCGVICSVIASHIGIKRTGEYFTAGMFHDVGKLAVAQLFPEKYRKVLALVRDESMYYRKAERIVFGEIHTDIGEYLLVKLNLPEELVEAVKYHHAPMDSRIDPMMASAVHISDIIAHMLHIGESGEPTVPKLEPFAEQKLGISLADLELLVPEIDQELKRSREMIFGTPTVSDGVEEREAR